MTTNYEVLERKSGSISTTVFEGTKEDCDRWMNNNTIILKNRGILTDVENLDCQSKDEYCIKIDIRIHADAKVRSSQIIKEGTLSTYRIIKSN